MAFECKLKLLLRKDSKYVNLRWVLAAPGPISESDVELASTCPEGQRVMILGFNTQVSQNADRTAKDYLRLSLVVVYHKGSKSVICCLNIPQMIKRAWKFCKGLNLTFCCKALNFDHSLEIKMLNVETMVFCQL